MNSLGRAHEFAPIVVVTDAERQAALRYFLVLKVRMVT